MAFGLDIAVGFFALLVLSYATQALTNAFVDKQNKSQTKRLLDASIRDKKNDNKKDPKIVGFPVPFDKKNNDETPKKKPNNDPVADKTPSGKPVPNTTDTPITKIPDRNIPSKTPVPPPQNNQTPTPTPLPEPVNVSKPPFFKRTGTFIYIPVEKVSFTLNSMPIDANGEPNWSPLNNAQSQANKIGDYVKYLSEVQVGKISEDHKLSNIIPYVISPTLNDNADPTLHSGTATIGKLADAFDLYSDGFFSNPLFFVPTTINIHQINGITTRDRKLPPEIENNFDPVHRVTTDVLLDNTWFKQPKEVSIERLLEFAGKVSSYKGGAEKWEAYKKDPSKLKDPKFFDDFKVPSTSDILNETIDPKAPKYQKQNLKVDSQAEMMLLMAGALYYKAGLHEFPSDPLPSVKNPAPLPENDKNQLNKSNTAIRINNLATAIAYVMSWFNFKVGDFPAEVEVQDPNKPEETKKQQVNISTALTGLLTMVGVGVAISNFNKDVNLTNAGQIEAAKNAALKAADCSCTNMANSGMNTSPKARCGKGAVNFTSAKGFQDMLTGVSQCRQGVENMESATIKDMLQNIMFGVNIIKSAFFKGEKDLENEQKAIKEMLKGKINEKELDKFIEEFNTGKSNLNNSYPIKAKIVKRPKNNGGKK
jgi:hypothetical protein